jgi:8-amino-7-oxononanoate synthase
MGTHFDDELRAEMAEWAGAGLRRELRASAQGADFVSNDYLGLAAHAEVARAAHAAVNAYGAGARASRSLGGGSPPDRAAEQACAQWLDAEDALLFTTGYQANLGLIPAIARNGDCVISDALVHASSIDACRLSRAKTVVFAHNDLEDLERALAGALDARRRIVLTEGVFGMDGDLAPLSAMAALCMQYSAQLVVDEAHSVGVLGPRGAGAWAAAEAAGAPRAALAARIVTGGKALGVQGAFVVGSRALREHLVNHARAFVFSTGASPAVAGALVAAIAVCPGADAERERALGHARRIATALDLPEPHSTIVPLVVGDGERALSMEQALTQRGLDARAVRPPTVPVGTSRLRIICHATNTDAEVERLIAALTELRQTTAPGASSAETRSAPALVICGTDTDVGKTVVSALLARAAARAGGVTYWKPVQTGDDSDTETVRALADSAGGHFKAPGYEFPLPASPHEAAAAFGATIEPAHLDELLAQHRRDACGTLLIELAGGLLVPLTNTLHQIDWVARHALPLVLVARSGLGTLNHTLLSLEALAARGLRPRALFLVGEAHKSNRATLARARGVTRVFEVPTFSLVEESKLDAWIASNDLGFLFT